MVGSAENRASSAPIELGLGLSLATTSKWDIHDIANLGQGLSWVGPVEPNPVHKYPTVCFTLVWDQSAALGHTQKKTEPD